LYEAGTTYPGINLIDQGIRDVIDTSPDKIETYREYMDVILFPDAADQQQFRDFYIRKYQNRRPDVIITIGPPPLEFNGGGTHEGLSRCPNRLLFSGLGNACEARS
jgi:hypothetical protein